MNSQRIINYARYRSVWTAVTSPYASWQQLGNNLNGIIQQLYNYNGLAAPAQSNGLHNGVPAKRRL